MQDDKRYSLTLKGWLTLAELPELDPARIVSITPLGSSTRLVFCSDQSGVMGLLRAVHDRGLEILSLGVEPLPNF